MPCLCAAASSVLAPDFACERLESWWVQETAKRTSAAAAIDFMGLLSPGNKIATTLPEAKRQHPFPPTLVERAQVVGLEDLLERREPGGIVLYARAESFVVILQQPLLLKVEHQVARLRVIHADVLLLVELSVLNH